MLNEKVANGLIEKEHLINGYHFFFMPIKVFFFYKNRTININSYPSVYYINGYYIEGYILMPVK